MYEQTLSSKYYRPGPIPLQAGKQRGWANTWLQYGTEELDNQQPSRGSKNNPRSLEGPETTKSSEEESRLLKEAAPGSSTEDDDIVRTAWQHADNINGSLLRHGYSKMSLLAGMPIEKLENCWEAPRSMDWVISSRALKREGPETMYQPPQKGDDIVRTAVKVAEPSRNEMAASNRRSASNRLIKVPAVIMNRRGRVPTVRTEAQRVWVDIFPIASYPIVPRDEVRLRRFNVLDRVQTKARADLAEEEDTLFFGTPTQGNSEFAAATDSAVVPEANTVQSSTEGVTKEVLAATYAEILQYDLIPDAVIINPREYVDFLTWTRDDVDMERQREILDTGRVGKVWNMQIFMSKLCPAGTVYMRTADEYLGVVPILIDLESIEFPDPKSIAYGFCFNCRSLSGETLIAKVAVCWNTLRARSATAQPERANAKAIKRGRDWAISRQPSRTGLAGVLRGHEQPALPRHGRQGYDMVQTTTSNRKACESKCGKLRIPQPIPGTSVSNHSRTTPLICWNNRVSYATSPLDGDNALGAVNQQGKSSWTALRDYTGSPCLKQGGDIVRTVRRRTEVGRNDQPGSFSRVSNNLRHGDHRLVTSASNCGRITPLICWNNRVSHTTSLFGSENVLSAVNQQGRTSNSTLRDYTRSPNFQLGGDIVRTAWRHAETSRNDWSVSYEKVTAMQRAWGRSGNDYPNGALN